MTQAMEKQALARIYGHGRGWAFSPLDFRDLGRVDMALNRLVEAGTIRRVIDQIRNWLPEAKRSKVLKDTERVTDWVYAALKWICREPGVGQ